MSQCERMMEEGAGKDKDQEISVESARALEKQCNKQCFKKYLKTFVMYNNMMKEV